MIAPILFAAFAGILVVSSLLVILQRNPVTSALFLVAAFCALAGIYLTLHAEFLGMVQIIVYAGAIMVLFLFVIMYMNLKHDVETGMQIAVRRGLGWIAGGVMAAEAVMLMSRGWSVGPTALPETVAAAGNTQAVGQVLYSRYLFPFEITSMVLLVAMVGAILISKSRRETMPTPAEPAKVVAAPMATVIGQPVAPVAPPTTRATAASEATT